MCKQEYAKQNLLKTSSQTAIKKWNAFEKLKLFKNALEKNRTIRSGFYPNCKNSGALNFATTGPILKIFSPVVFFCRAEQMSVIWCWYDKKWRNRFFISISIQALSITVTEATIHTAVETKELKKASSVRTKRCQKNCWKKNRKRWIWKGYDR